MKGKISKGLKKAYKSGKRKPWNLGKKCPEHAEKIRGRKHSEETKKKMSEVRKGRSFGYKFPRGKNHPCWKGGRSRNYKEGYYSTEYIEWRKKVFERDNYTCQKCRVKGNKVYLTAHHKKSWTHYPKLRFLLSNGETLCEDCYILTDNYKGRANRKKSWQKE